MKFNKLERYLAIDMNPNEIGHTAHGDFRNSRERAAIGCIDAAVSPSAVEEIGVLAIIRIEETQAP